MSKLTAADLDAMSDDDFWANVHLAESDYQSCTPEEDAQIAAIAGKECLISVPDFVAYLAIRAGRVKPQ